MSIKPTEYVNKLVPYRVSQSGQLSLEDKPRFLKLDWNEATFPLSPVVKKRLLEFLETNSLNYYPDVMATELRQKLSLYVGLDASHIQVFNGSDAAINTICDTYISAGDAVLVREPVYTQPFIFIRVKGANTITFTGETPFSKSLDKYHKYLSNHNIKLVYIANPNNPTGVFYEISEIGELLQAFPKTLFVIDEAYSEYTRKTVIGLVEYNHNLIVARTFSKAFGLAGLRMGYLISQPSIIGNLNKVRNGKDVNVIGQIAASASLDDLTYIDNQINDMIETREWLVKNLLHYGIECRGTPANFILIRVPNVSEVIRRLAEQKILVRDRSHLPQLDGYIRVTIGTPEEMRQFFEVFTALPDSLIRIEA